MGGVFKVRITKSAGEIRDLRYRFIWSAWLDGIRCVVQRLADRVIWSLATQISDRDRPREETCRKMMN